MTAKDSITGLAFARPDGRVGETNRLIIGRLSPLAAHIIYANS